MDVLYHYCPAPAFLAIVKTRSIWLSSLNLSNDSMEGKLLKSVLTRLAERDGLDKAATKTIVETIANVESLFEGLGFCLSEEGDLLSQWRGYAADATGLSIGFSRKYLEDLSADLSHRPKPGFTLEPVAYSHEAHDAQVEPAYWEIRNLVNSGAFTATATISEILDPETPIEILNRTGEILKKDRSLFLALFGLFNKLYVLKSNEFREEREWRLISYIKGSDHGSLFRERGNLIIPYRQFSLPLHGGQPIADIVLGPKHPTPPNVVARLLRQNGFGEIKVRRSAISYR